jgi:hypothetical protein
MEGSKPAMSKEFTPLDQALCSMGRWSPSEQHHGDFSAAHLLTLNSPEFNERIFQLRPSTQIDAMKLKVLGWTDLSEADEGRLVQRFALSTSPYKPHLTHRH